MGDTLSKPVTAKETSSCSNSTYKVGSSCMQGWRTNMEDAHTHLLSVPENKECSFFAVYDGHSGATVAQYAGNHLHKKIVQSEDFIKGDIEKSIKLGFMNLDKEMKGNLALSRALGDFVFKRNDEKTAEEQIVTAYPDVIEKELGPDMEFIVLACDGIWDVLSNQEVCDFCRDRLAAKAEPETICEELLTRCLAPDCQMGGLGCDNMTAILVCLLQGQTWEEFCHKCARPRPPTPPMDDGDCSPPLIATPQVPSFCPEDVDGPGDLSSPPDTTQTNLTSGSSVLRDGNAEEDEVSLPYSTLSDDSEDSPSLGGQVGVDLVNTTGSAGANTLNNPPNKMSKMDSKKSGLKQPAGANDNDDDELPPVDFQCDPKSPPPTSGDSSAAIGGGGGGKGRGGPPSANNNNSHPSSAALEGSSPPSKTTTVTRH